MIKLRVFKKGPTYHRHTQKKTWAVFFLPVSRFLLLCPTQIPQKKNETPPANVGPRIHRHWPQNVERFPNFQHSDQPRRNVPKEGLQPRSRLKVVLFEQHVGLAEIFQMSQTGFLVVHTPKESSWYPYPPQKKKQTRSDGCLLIDATAEFPD